MKKLIVGLGNPGVKYKLTRHNLGFIILDTLAEAAKLKWKESSKFEAKYVSFGDISLLKPLTFMNNSGTSVAKFAKYYSIELSDICVIHDDLDLPFLEIKKQFGAGSAGHNGVEDIMEKLKSKGFWRIRVGIGRPENSNIDPVDWVLTSFTKAQLDALNLAAADVQKLVF